MLFTGASTLLKCKSCENKYSHNHATSLIPTFGVVIYSTVVYAAILKPVLEGPFLRFSLSFIGTIIFIILLFFLTKLPSNWYFKKCRNCGGKLEKTGSGFYHGIIPLPSEIVVYVIAILIPTIVLKASI